MIIIAFDPGTYHTGYAILNDKSELLKYGVISSADRINLGKRLQTIYKYTTDLIRAYGPAVIACEDQFVGGNKKTALILREATAIIRLASTEWDVPFILYGNTDVKKAVCKDGRASKEKIREAVQKKFNVEIKDNNITDAIAVGLTSLNKEQEETGEEE